MDINYVFVAMIVFVVLAVVRRSGGAAWRVGQRKMEETIEQLRAEQAAALPRGPTLDQVQMLEDRVRVLERIVTDQNYSLARDIEALRDPRDARHTEEKI
jgi:hypothetical protein